MQCFLVKQHRDAEPRAVARPALDVVREFRRGAGAVRVAGSLDAADAESEPARCAGGSESAGGLVGDGGLAAPKAEHLGDFFLERHAPKEVVNAPFDREARVAVGSAFRTACALPGRATGDDQCCGGNDECNAVTGHFFLHPG